MRTMVLVLSMLASGAAFGQERSKVTADIVKSGDGWVLAGQGRSADAAKAAAEVRRARRDLAALKSQLLGKQYDQGRLAEMERRIAALESRLAGLVDGLAKAPAAPAPNGDGKALAALGKRLSDAEGALASFPKPAVPRRVQLDISGFGLGALKYTHAAGAAIGVRIPLGYGVWGSTTRFGFGIGPSNGFGLTVSTAVDASLAKGRILVGPAAIASVDFDNLLAGPRNFVLGGGIEATLSVWRGLFVSALPFAGVTQESGSRWIAPSYAYAPCGKVLVSEGHWAQTSGKWNSFTAGALGNIGWRFF